MVKQETDALALALFVDAAVVANLERHDPGVALHDGNFADFCLAVEGVSHFVYVALRAAGDRPVSPLELELQAEVDKFACCRLVAGADPLLRRRLYGGVAGRRSGRRRARALPDREPRGQPLRRRAGASVRR